MKTVIKLRGKHNDLELGFYNHDLGYYETTGLLADDAHQWKILGKWINQNLEDGFPIRGCSDKRRDDGRIAKQEQGGVG